MALITKAVRGTRDVLPAESHLNRYIENTALETARNFGFHEIRVPVFEHTELFERGVGDTTDVVQKEMYTFFDKSGRSITLRPEGTAGVARACMENGLLGEALPCKVSYITNCYRYDKPQMGRYREHSQFGVECFGAATPAADAEVIALTTEFFSLLSLTDYRLELNSIGCPACRKVYLEALREYFGAYVDELCGTCHGRLERNPMRLLDCKSPVCSLFAQKAPVMPDFLCGDCQAHFSGVQELLQAMEIVYTLNPRLVRGMDYYTRTVFECVSETEALAGLALGGGGRYDGLIEQLGGAPTPGLGFGLGIERILLHLQAIEAPMPEREGCELYIATRGDEALVAAAKLAHELRGEGFAVQFDTVGRSLKSQMKYADKIGARYTTVLGEDELSGGMLRLKHMADGTQQELPLAGFAERFAQQLIAQAQEELQAWFNE